VRTGTSIAALLLVGFLAGGQPTFTDSGHYAGHLNPGDTGIIVQEIVVAAEAARDLSIYAVSIRNEGTATHNQVIRVELWDGGRVLAALDNPVGLTTGGVTVATSFSLPAGRSQRLYLRVWIAGVGAITGGEIVKLSTKFFYLSGGTPGQTEWVSDSKAETILKAGFEQITESAVERTVVNPGDSIIAQSTTWKDVDANTSGITLRRVRLENLGSATKDDVQEVRVKLIFGSSEETIVFTNLTGWERGGVVHDFARGLSLSDEVILLTEVTAVPALAPTEMRTIRTKITFELEENGEPFTQASTSPEYISIRFGGIDEIREESTVPVPPVLNPNEQLVQQLVLRDHDSNLLPVDVTKIWLRNVPGSTATGAEISQIIVSSGGRTLASENRASALATFNTTGVEISFSSTLTIPDEGEATLIITYQVANVVTGGHTLRPEVKVWGEEAREASGWSPIATYPTIITLYPTGLEIAEDRSSRGETIYSTQRVCVQKIYLRDYDQNRAQVLINPVNVKNLGSADSLDLVKLEITDSQGNMLAQTTNLAGILTSGVTLSLSSGNVIPDDGEKELWIWVTVAGPSRNVAGKTVRLKTTLFGSEDGQGFQRDVESAGTFTLAVNNPPEVSFSWRPESPKYGEEVTFTPSVRDPDGDTIVYSRWDFGRDAQPQYTERAGPPEATTARFLRGGAHSVTLTVRDSRGVEGSRTQTVTIFATGFEIAENIRVDSATVYSGQRFVAQKIRLEDKDDNDTGVSITRIKVTNKGTAGDEEFVKLEIRKAGEDGALLVETTNLTGLKSGGLTLTPTANNSVNDDQSAEIWIWLTLAGPEKTEAGKTVQLETVFTATEGRESADTQALEGSAFTLAINQPPTVTFTWEPRTPRVGEVVRFTSTVTDPDEPRDARFIYKWDFGDGTTSTEANPSHIYREARTYTVKLEVTDSRGAKGTKEETITVRGAPTPTVTTLTADPISPEVDQDVRFTAAATAPQDAPITRWKFDFGDGTVREFENGGTTVSFSTTYRYTTPGSYTVKVQAQNSVGWSEPRTLTIYVRPKGAVLWLNILDNPAQNQCRLQIAVPPQATDVKLYILDIAGRLVLEKSVTPGTFNWDLKDRDGRAVPNGLYFVFITAKVGDKTERSEIGRILVRR
jgi:PKD repeat protein